MLTIAVPGYETLRLEHLVLDFNGTLACDGVLMAGVTERLDELSRQLSIHVVTADTFGNAAAALAGLPCRLSILPVENQDAGKLAYVERLGCDKVVCIGNGRNDRRMLKAAALGIAVIQREAASSETVIAADIVAIDILDALDLLTHPLRLAATLRA
jgi:soluble P-type ATPase